MRTTPDPTSTVRQSDWDGRDLAGETHTAVAFVDLDLMEVRNDGSVFTDCRFQGVRLNASVHSAAAFLNCTFTRCSFFDATFSAYKLEAAPSLTARSASRRSRAATGPLSDWPGRT
jgi:uncharacterized protein YjbI with pentapeptide repeats